MSDAFANAARDNMGAIEKLIKGLPGVSGYVDKELRRDADKRVRELLAARLDEQKQALFNIQKSLLNSGGLKYVDDVDGSVQKLQTLIDRIKTASYGYAGFFDPVRIKEEELIALHKFDVAMMERTVDVEAAVDEVGGAVDSGDGILDAVGTLNDLLSELNTLYKRRSDAVENPDLLLDSAYAPKVEAGLLEDSTATDSDQNATT